MRILNANASSAAGELPIEASLPQVWIDDPARADEAKKRVEEFFKGRRLGPPRRCPQCGEENPSTFETCWACGSPV